MEDRVLFSSFLIRTLLGGDCLHCGAPLCPDGASIPSRVPAGWPAGVFEFLSTEHTLRSFGVLDIPADVLCMRCWLSLKPATGRCLPGPGGSLVAAPFFTDERLLEVIRFLKFGGGRTASVPLGWWMAVALKGLFRPLGLDPGRDAVLVPVPLHRSRRSRRGFDQALLLASEVARHTGAPVARGVVLRHRRTRPQSSLDAKERRSNVAAAFRATGRPLPPGRRTVIVDDLYTTGATVSACASVLLDLSGDPPHVLTAGMPESGSGKWPRCPERRRTGK